MISLILNTIKRNFKRFLLILFIVSVASIFLMNFISLPALILDKQIIFAPDITVFGGMYLIIFSILAGVAILLSTNKLSATGIGFGMLVSACPVCQSLLVTYGAVLIGVPVSFSFLPLKGEEFKIISLALLVISIYFVSKNEKCEIKK